MEENKIIELKKGHVLYNRGEECSTMFILKSGKVGLYLNYGTDKQFAFITMSEPGSSLGEMGLLEGENRNGTLVAEEDSVLVEIERDNFPLFLERNPEMGVRIISDLAHRFKIATQELKHTQALVKEVIDLLNEEKLNSKPSLKERIVSFANRILEVPNDMPPDLYVTFYGRNHTNMF